MKNIVLVLLPVFLISLRAGANALPQALELGAGYLLTRPGLDNQNDKNGLFAFGKMNWQYSFESSAVIEAGLGYQYSSLEGTSSTRRQRYDHQGLLLDLHYFPHMGMKENYRWALGVRNLIGKGAKMNVFNSDDFEILPQAGGLIEWSLRYFENRSYIRAGLYAGPLESGFSASLPISVGYYFDDLKVNSRPGAEKSLPVESQAVVQETVKSEPLSVSMKALPFEVNKASLPLEASEKLIKLGQALSRHTADFESLSIKGHTDASGNKGKNEKLSEARAKTVKKLLIKGGMSAGKIKSEGRGSKDLLVGLPSNAADHRRVEFEFFGASDEKRKELQSLVVTILQGQE